MAIAHQFRHYVSQVLIVMLVATSVALAQGLSRPTPAHAAGLVDLQASILSVEAVRIAPLLLQEKISVDVEVTLTNATPNTLYTVVVEATTLMNGIVPEGAGVLTSALTTDANGNASEPYELEYNGLLTESPGTSNVQDVICSALNATGVEVAADETNVTFLSS